MNKVIKIILMSTFIIIMLSSNILAVGDIFTTGGNWIKEGKSNAGSTIDTSKLSSTSSIIYNVFLGIGTAIVVIVGAILGVQFMTAGIDKRVEVKQALVPYVISSIVLFGAFGIWKLVVTIANQVTSSI